MENNEIYIDGVNVAGCRYFQDGMCYAEKDNEGYTDIECNYDNYDCYFKQLERIKPENKALYVLKNSLCKMIDEDSEKIKSLEQENKELKEKYAHVLELAKTNADSNEYCLQELEKENKELKISNSNLDNQLHRTNEMMSNCNNRLQKYRSALEEIREIAKDIIENDVYENSDVKAEKILTRINEVLE